MRNPHRSKAASGPSTSAVNDARYRIAPQMRIYDQLPFVLAPYLTTISQPGFCSTVVNTDAQGFRLSYAGEMVIESRSWWRAPRRGLVLGDSMAFGVGTTHDRHTLTSVLSTETGMALLNLGVRASNSTQQLIAAIPFLSDAHVVVICSGMNNLVTGLQSIGRNELFAPFFAEDVIDELSAYPMHDVARMVRASLRDVSLTVLLDALSARVRERFARRLRAHPEAHDAAGNGSGGHPVDQTQVFASALARQRRDLAILKKALPRDATLLFVAQPFAGTRRSCSSEEQQLFGFMDAIQGTDWAILKRHLTDWWPVYVEQLRAMCEQETVRFLDLNAAELTGWAYVDRVHLTDHGCRQAAGRIAQEIC